MSDKEIPEENDVVMDSVFTFNQKYYDSRDLEDKVAIMDFIYKFVKDECFKLNLEKHLPKKSESHFIE